MEKRNLMAWTGGTLILIGLVLLAATTLLPAYGVDVFRWGVARVWPLIVIAAGWGFILPPLLIGNRMRGLGGLYIPGLSVLTTGGILLFCSLTGWWAAWRWFWPLEVLGVAAGFFAAAAHMRVIWLLIPAIVVGANGLLFQFCTVTGMWQVWAVMWTVEPLSVGVALLGIGVWKGHRGLTLAGAILCVVASFALLGMSVLMSTRLLWLDQRPFRLFVAILLILIGLLFLLWNSLYRLFASPYPRR